VYALTKSPWTPLVWRPAAVAVIITVVALPTSTIVVVARAVVTVVVDTLRPPSGLGGVPCIAVGPKAASDRRVAAPPPSPHSRCWEGGGFRPCADSAPALPRSEHCREAEPSVCCVAALSSNNFSC
jgi:hypothetical protein